MNRFWTCHWQFRYWRPDINGEGHPIRSSGSNSFRKRGVSVGDSVYIIALILLPEDFQQQVDQGKEAAIELEEMLLTRRPEELFAAEDQTDWDDWFEFFRRTREADGRQKGLVEIAL